MEDRANDEPREIERAEKLFQFQTFAEIIRATFIDVSSVVSRGEARRESESSVTSGVALPALQETSIHFRKVHPQR